MKGSYDPNKAIKPKKRNKNKDKKMLEKQRQKYWSGFFFFNFFLKDLIFKGYWDGKKLKCLVGKMKKLLLLRDCLILIM